MTRGEVNRLMDAAAAIAERKAPKSVGDAARVHDHAGHFVHQSEKGTPARAAAEQAHVMAAVALVREVDAWIRFAVDLGDPTECGRNLIVAGGARRCRRCTSPIDTTEAPMNAQRSPLTVAAWLAEFCCAMCMSNDARDQQVLGTAWWLKGAAQ